MRDAATVLELGDGRLLSLLDLGRPSSPAVVYCHGTPGSRWDVDVVAPAIASSGLRVIAVDRPGYGFSDPVPDASIPAFCDDLRKVADHLRVERLSVVGYSLGALYALGCARWLRDLVHHVTLVSPMPPGWDWPFRRAYRWRPIPRAINATVGAYVRHRPSAGVERLRASVAEPDRRVLDDPAVASSVERTYVEMLRRGSQGWVADDLVAARCTMPLSHIDVPVTVWRGADDRLVPRSAVDDLVADLPQAELRLVEGAGHFVGVSHADELCASLRDVSGGVDPRTTPDPP